MFSTFKKVVCPDDLKIVLNFFIFNIFFQLEKGAPKESNERGFSLLPCLHRCYECNL